MKMILRSHINDFYSLIMRLNVNDKLEYIELTVSFTNKANEKQTTKQFAASEFSKALACYNEIENIMF
jgi:hypothetical protein